LNGTASPGVRIFETLTLGTPTQLPRSHYPRESRTQFADAVAWVHAGHTFHLGADVLHITDAIENLNAQAGSYSYDNMQDYLIDEAIQQASPAVIPAEHCGTNNASQYLCYSRYEQGFGQPGLSFGGNLVAFYAQDDWHVAPRFTVNLGLRYDYQQLPSPQLPNPLLAATQQFNADKAGLAPRLGFAWKPSGTKRTVLRGGYGIFRATTPGTTLYNALVNTGVLTSQQRGQAKYDFATSTANSSQKSPHYPDTLDAPPSNLGQSATQPVVGPNVTILAPHFRQPYVQQASLTVETEITAHTIVHATGMLSLARELPITVDTNLLPPGSNDLPGTVTYSFQGGGPLNNQTVTLPLYAGVRPYAQPSVCDNGQLPCFGAINTLESRVNATYSALSVGVRHTATHHLDLRAHYTWSHAVDDGQQTSASATRNDVLDPNNFAAERGRSTLDRPNRLVVAAVYSPVLDHGSTPLRLAANGWHIAPIVQIASGAPYSATVVGTAPAQENASGSQTLSPVSHGLLGAGGDDFLPTLGRNSFRQPLTQVTDLRIGRAIPTGTERIHLQAAAEAFNLLNHRNISSATTDSAVNTIAYRIGSGQSHVGTPEAPAVATWQPDFGQPVSANATNLFSSRQLQFVLRAEF
jgi:hypothetical protein